MINAKAKNKDRLIRFFSYMTSEEATLDAQYGVDCYDIVGGAVKIKADKEKEFAENPKVAMAKYMSDISYFMDWTIIQKYFPKTFISEIDKDINMAEMDSSMPMYDDKCFADVNPVMGTDLASKKAKIDEYWKAAIPKIVMAANEQECEANYKKSIAEIENLGYAEVEKYINTRFKENKSRLGIKYAWPGAAQ